MKKIIVVLSIFASFLLTSCNKNKEDVFQGVATATVKPLAGDRYYLKLDEDNALLVNNSGWDKFPFEKVEERRVMLSYLSNMKDIEPRPVGMEKFKYIYSATLTNFDPIPQKNLVPHTEDDDKAYGKDFIGVYLDQNIFPPTIIEDGYLNILFNINLYDSSIKHEVNLVYGVDESDPYVLELRYNANGDIRVESKKDQYFAFSLRDLPDTHGETVKLTLKWYSPVAQGWTSTEFKYKSRTDWPVGE